MKAKINREEWLNKAVVELQKEFFGEWNEVVNISTGWCRGSKKAIGQCWAKEASAGKMTEIFISPQLDDVVSVLATTLHELIHAKLGTAKGHGKEFKAYVKEFGLAGRVTATFAAEGSELYERLSKLGKAIGEFPHKKLSPVDVKAPEKEKDKGAWQRFKSVTADDYRVMVSPKSLREHGIPLDPWGVELIPTK